MDTYTIELTEAEIRTVQRALAEEKARMNREGNVVGLHVVARTAYLAERDAIQEIFYDLEAAITHKVQPQASGAMVAGDTELPF